MSIVSYEAVKREWDAKIKPCPFCGAKPGKGENEVAVDMADHGHVGIFVGCRGCGAWGPKATGYGLAVECWNRRAVDLSS